MADTKVNKHESRTRETRALLLQAAETIFVRDGYEGAELGEIAALAGRTKGAIYAQFKSKEDVFLALVEDRTLRFRAQMQDIIAESTSIEENIAAMRHFFLETAEDQAWSLLLLEFKLFAMRHPQSKKRFQSLFAGFSSQYDEKKLAKIIGPAQSKSSLSRVVAVQALLPAMSALVLEAQLGTSFSGTNVLKKVAERIFDALLEVPPRKSAKRDFR
jgi:AcrR family transcriptional regulator